MARFYQIPTFCLSIIIFHLPPFSSIFEMLIKCYTMETSGISFGYQYASTRIARKWCTIQGTVVVHSETNVHHHHNNIHNQQHHHLRIGSALLYRSGIIWLKTGVGVWRFIMMIIKSRLRYDEMTLYIRYEVLLGARGGRKLIF